MKKLLPIIAGSKYTEKIVQKSGMCMERRTADLGEGQREAPVFKVLLWVRVSACSTPVPNEDIEKQTGDEKRLDKGQILISVAWPRLLIQENMWPNSQKQWIIQEGSFLGKEIKEMG